MCKWLPKMAPLACAVLMSTACGGSDDRREERAVESLQGRPTAQTSLTLTGCVQAGSLETRFVLENVRTAATGAQPHAEGQTAGQGDRATVPASDAITEGSFVQLQTANEAELHKYVGQQVRVVGTLIDKGANTIGTGGARGQALPSGDRSMASATDMSNAEKKAQEAGRIGRESMANGTAPIIRVQEIQGTGQACSGGQAPIGKGER